MTARRLRPVLALVLACAMTCAFAQATAPAPATPATRTGDAWVDRQLDDINRYGTRYRDAFIDELVRYHGAPRELVLDLIERKWPPGDIYYACALGTAAGRPCRHVVDQYTHGDGVTWQVIAQQIGVESGSAQFHRLKRGLVATYGRWGRPIEADTQAGPRKPQLPVEPVAVAKPPANTTELPIEPPPAAHDKSGKRTDVQRRSNERQRDDR